MSTPHLSILPGGTAAAAAESALDGAAQNGATQLHLPGPVQVHIHLGQASAPGAQATQATQAAPLRRPVLLTLFGLMLIGGGCAFGILNAAAPPRVGAIEAVPSNPLPLPPPPPNATTELPLGLRQQLARPPVLIPPPGTAPPTPGTAPPSGPARNPFGLGN